METNLVIIRADKLKQIVIEAVDTALLNYSQASSNNQHLDLHPFGDLNWLCSVWPRPKATIKQLSATGSIPGKIKIGRGVLYEKATVLQWIRSNTCNKSLTASELEQAADEQFEREHKKKNGAAKSGKPLKRKT